MRANYFPTKRMCFRCPMFTTAKGLPGSYTITKPRNFPEEQKKKKKERIGTISMETPQISSTQFLHLEKI